MTKTHLKRKSKKFPWLAVGAGAAVLLVATGALASGGGGSPAPAPGPTPTPGPVPVPGTGVWGPGFVNTKQTGPAGNLALRDAPSTSGNVLEWLPHGSSVQYQDSADQNGYTPVKAPDGVVGWAATQFIDVAT